MLLLERGRANDLNEARGWAVHASRLAPKLPVVLYCRGELLAAAGELEAALNLFDEAIRALPPEHAQRRVWEERAKALGR
jgi:tetratricopeptide (TPR) repeat protein